MSEAARSPWEAVLRIVAAAAPQPWYPRLHAEKTGVSLDSINYLLEHLWLDGLLEKGGTTPETGGGVRLSPLGESVLRDPDALRRLRAGEPLKPNDRGGIVRAVLRQRHQPVITRLLLWTNILWFGYGLYLAQSRHNAARAFLNGARAANLAWHQTGSVSPDDLIHGDWWRLLSCCFVHFGLLHLACNMYGVYAIGRGVEQMWNRWRYLAIYLLSGFSGSCLALAYGPGTMDGTPPHFEMTQLAGASGALCGLLGAELVWLLLNGRFLPRRVVRRWWWGMGLNLLLLIGFSAMANVSALGHFGGMAVGAAAALLLSVQRFGPAGWRWLTLLPLAAIPWLGVEMIQRQRVVNLLWQHAEESDYKHVYQGRLDAAERVERAYDRVVQANPKLSAVKKLAEIQRASELRAALEADLDRPGQYRSPEVAKSLESDREKNGMQLAKLKQVEEKLLPLVAKEVTEKAETEKARLQRQAEEEKRKAEEEKQRLKREAEEAKEETAFVQKFGSRMKQTTAAAEKVLAQQLQPLLDQVPEKREPRAIGAARMALVEQRAALDRLIAELNARGEIGTERVETTRRVGRDYLVALDRLLGLSESRLLGGEAWTADEAAEWRKQKVTVEQRGSDWLDREKKPADGHD